MMEDDLYRHLETEIGLIPARRSPGGEVFFTKADALHLVKAAHQAGFGILGIEGFKHGPSFIQPQM